MLVSMTGFGEGIAAGERIRVRVELRAINNRYLRTSVRCEGYTSFEARIEEVVRGRVKRGSLHGQMRVEIDASPDSYRINAAVLESYQQQLQSLKKILPNDPHVAVATLLQLPGVIQETVSDAATTDVVWPLAKAALDQALDQLCAMREREGEIMCQDLKRNLTDLEKRVEVVQVRAPKVVVAYQKRLSERITQALHQHDASAEPADVVREVGIFAERCDVSEEIVRLKSHCQQFRECLELPKSNGRKLEFLVQEMVRETNTIGSKANDSEISQQVVEMKSAIERMREMIQNVE